MDMVQTDIEDAEYLGKAKQSRDIPGIIKVQNKHLLPIMARAASVVGRSTSIPILACVMLTTVDGSLIIEANNLELAITDMAPAECMPGLKTCVNAGMLFGALQRVGPNAEITLEAKGESLVLRATGVRLAMEAHAADEFPSLASGAFQTRFSMPSAALANMLNCVRPFISTEESRYYLRGVHFFISTQIGVRSLRAEATNGVELGIVRVPPPMGSDEMPDVDIPGSTINELIKLLDSEADIEIAVAEAKIMFKINGITILSKLIAATYPDCDRVVPRETSNTLVVQKVEFLRALALARVVDTGKTPHVKLDLSSDRVIVTAGSGQNEVATELAPGSFEYVGEALSIPFFNRSLTRIAEIADKRIEFGFSGSDAPCIAHDPDDDAAVYVAMATRW